MTERLPLRDYSHSRAVLVATWDYAFLTPVPAARNSLQRMVRLLTGDFCGWPRDRLMLMDNERDPGSLPDRLITAFEDATGVALFYYVGHGQIDTDDQLCLGLVRSRPEPNRRTATSLTFPAVRRALLDSHAATKIVILDCCFAGLASRPASTLADLTDDVLDLTAGTGAYTLAATSAYTTAWFENGSDTTRPQTFFTKYLADLVETGIPGQPAGLRLYPLFTQLRDNLARDDRPIPTQRSIDAARDFVFAHNAAPPETHRDPDLELRRLTDRLANAEAQIQSLQTGTDAPDGQESEAAPLRGRGLLARLGTAGRRTIVLLGILGVLIAAAAASTVFYLERGNASTTDVINEPGGEDVSAIAFSPDSKIVATSDGIGNTYLWTAASRQLITALGDPSSQGIRAMAFSPGGGILATADEGGHAYLWDATTHALLATLSVPNSGAVSAVAFSPDGKTIAVGAGDDTTVAHCYLWDVATHRLINTISPPGTDVVDSLAFSPNGQLLATGTFGKTFLWDTATGKMVATLSDPRDFPIMGLAFEPNGATIITTDIDSDNDALLWSTVTHRLVAKLSDPAGFVNVLGVSVSRDGKYLAVVAGQGEYSYDRLWQLTTRRLVATFKSAPDQGGIAVAFSPNGKTLAYSFGAQTYLFPLG